MNKITFLLIGILLLISGTIFVVSYVTAPNRPISLNGSQEIKELREKQEAQQIQKKIYLGCYSERDVLIDGDTAYIGCDGGVLVQNLKTKRIEKTLTMADGLTNEYVNSIVKYNNKLYLGNQNGIDIYNLATGKTSHIGMQEGLSNNSNVMLTLDGDNLWAGTFDGLNLIDLKTHKVTVFKKEISPESNKLNVVQILPTKDFVYISVAASAESPGAIARYYKDTGRWGIFTHSDFNKTGQYARLDYFDLYKDGDEETIYLFETLHNIESFDEQFSQAVSNKTGFKIANNRNASISQVSVNDKEAVRELVMQVSKRVVDSKPSFTVNKAWHIVDDKLFVGGGDYSQGIFELAINTGELKQIGADIFPKEDIVYFEPQKNSNISVLLFQTCGMGCSEAKMFLLNHTNYKIEEIKIPFKTKEDRGMMIHEFDSTNFELSLVNFLDKKVKVYRFNPANKNLALLETKEYTDDEASNEMLNKSSQNTYKLGTNLNLTGNLKIGRTKKELEDLGLAISGDATSVTVRTRGRDFKVKVLPPRYSPFDNWDNTTVIKKVQVVDEFLWIGTDRGLVKLNTKSGESLVLGPKNGLISPIINDFVVYGNKLISLYNGISLIDLAEIQNYN